MPIAKRYIVEGHTYHLTHRCHDRDFLLRFARDRSVYREWLRRAVLRYRVPVYGYCVTSNHVHVIVRALECDALARMMDLVAGATARQYNRRKGRSGGFWEDSYHATAIEPGPHLWRCLRYVDLNMVRTARVAHPSEWPWCGYAELMGQRQRYRLLDIPGLLEALDVHDVDGFQRAYQDAIRHAIEARELTREATWTEALAVGSQRFVENVASKTHRRKLVYEAIAGEGGPQTWIVREPPTSGYDAGVR